MPKNKFIRVVVDTNLWISFLISNKQHSLDSLLFLNKARLLFSSELLDEIRTTITKPKLKKYFSANAMEEMLLSLESYIEVVDINSSVKICRDPKDNFILSLSKDGEADYLITGDKDLLELRAFGNTQIITISAFLEQVKRLQL
jgi:uncharacterized protein